MELIKEDKLYVEVVPSVAPKVYDLIREAARVPNPDKAVAEHEHTWGWQQMPDFLEFAEWAANDETGKEYLAVPRGMTDMVRNGLRDLNIPYTYLDRTAWRSFDAKLTSPMLRQHQQDALERMEGHSDFIYKAPPGSGKTITACKLIELFRQKTLVIVDRTNLLHQWKERIKFAIGAEAGIIGDGTIDLSQNITIAMQQTLHSMYKQGALESITNRFGLVILDECHHVSADTYMNVIQHFPAHYRIGLSATPGMDETRLDIAEMVLGPIVATTTRDELREAGYSVPVSVFMVNTDFRFDFRATKRTERGVERNNYQNLISDIIVDDKRNALIAEVAIRSPAKKHLVVSKRLEHLAQIRSAIETLAPIMAKKFLYLNLVGEMTVEERVLTIEQVGLTRMDLVLFSTLADEALDIPQLDAIHIVYPTRNHNLLEQQVGRIERVAHDKDIAYVYDYHDRRVSVLSRQYRQRARGLYLPAGFEIKTLDV